MYRIIIARGRDFNNYPVLKVSMDDLLSALFLSREEVVIVSGTARGADKLGERYAKERGLKVHRYPADWNRQADGSYDASAGYKRNIKMAENADACVCFWDGESKGTSHMINIAKIKAQTLLFQTIVDRRLNDGRSNK